MRNRVWIGAAVAATLFACKKPTPPEKPKPAEVAKPAIDGVEKEVVKEVVKEKDPSIALPDAGSSPENEVQLPVGPYGLFGDFKTSTGTIAKYLYLPVAVGKDCYVTEEHMVEVSGGTGMHLSNRTDLTVSNTKTQKCLHRGWPPNQLPAFPDCKNSKMEAAWKLFPTNTAYTISTISHFDDAKGAGWIDKKVSGHMWTATGDKGGKATVLEFKDGQVPLVVWSGTFDITAEKLKTSKRTAFTDKVVSTLITKTDPVKVEHIKTHAKRPADFPGVAPTLCGW